MLPLIGLGLIVLAWLYQLWSLVSGNKSIRLGFVGVYVLGVLILVVNGFMAAPSISVYFDLVSLIASFLVGVVLLKD